MLDSPLLDVAISLVFVFFLMSVLTSGVTEFVLSFFQKRGRDLRWAINEVFNDKLNKNWAELMYDHPLIDGLRKTDDYLPSYISATVFAQALIDVIIAESKDVMVTSSENGEVIYKESYPSDSLIDSKEYTYSNTEKSYINFKAGAARLRPGDVRTMLNNFIYKAKDFEELKHNIETWYNEYMERASGWYKKEVRIWLLAFGLVLAIIINVDSIKLLKETYKNKPLRDLLVKQAEGYVENKMTEEKLTQTISAQIDSAAKENKVKQNSDVIYAQYITKQLKITESIIDSLHSFNLPIGWESYNPEIKSDTVIPECLADSNYCKKQNGWFAEARCRIVCTYESAVYKISSSEFWKAWKQNFKKVKFINVLGWLFTAIAVSFGAPFWFDALSKLVNMRNSGKKPSTVPEKQT